MKFNYRLEEEETFDYLTAEEEMNEFNDEVNYYNNDFENEYNYENTLNNSYPVLAKKSTLTRPIPLSSNFEPRKREYKILKRKTPEKIVTIEEVQVVHEPMIELKTVVNEPIIELKTVVKEPMIELKTVVNENSFINVEKEQFENETFTVVEKKKKQPKIVIEEKINKYYLACKNPNCKFGINCIFAHKFRDFCPTDCKFDKRCKKSACTFKHSNETKSEFVRRLNIAFIEK